MIEEPKPVSVTIGKYTITQFYQDSPTPGCLWISINARLPDRAGEGMDLNEKMLDELYRKHF